MINIFTHVVDMFFFPLFTNRFHKFFPSLWRADVKYHQGFEHKKTYPHDGRLYVLIYRTSYFFAIKIIIKQVLS